MKSEIITVGSEILLGDIVDTNSEYITRQLVELGINCYYHTAVGDNEERLTDTIKRALNRSDIIFLSGGLGPTYDDMTKEVVAKILNLELEFDQVSYDRIVDIFGKSNRVLTPNNRKQALVPKGAKILTNYRGTAPGILIEKDNKIIVLLPGPPSEMYDMFEKSVKPYFMKMTGKTIISHRVYLFDIGESLVEDILEKEMKSLSNPTIAPYSGNNGIYLRITASANSVEEAESLMKPLIDKVCHIFKDNVYSVDGPTLEAAVIKKLTENNLKLSSAESCTGGLLGKRLTDIPGSSKVYDMGLVTYSDAVKHKLLNVKLETLSNYGAVSEETAIEMAGNLLELSDSDVSVAITGIAGPTGATKTKPVGLVYVCVKYKERTLVKTLNLSRNYSNDRERIRSLSASHALKMVLDII